MTGRENHIAGQKPRNDCKKKMCEYGRAAGKGYRMFVRLQARYPVRKHPWEARRVLPCPHRRLGTPFRVAA